MRPSAARRPTTGRAVLRQHAGERQEGRPCRHDVCGEGAPHYSWIAGHGACSRGSPLRSPPPPGPSLVTVRGSLLTTGCARCPLAPPIPPPARWRGPRLRPRRHGRHRHPAPGTPAPPSPSRPTTPAPTPTRPLSLALQPSSSRRRGPPTLPPCPQPRGPRSRCR